MFRNIPFLIIMVLDFSLKIKSARSNICAKSSNSRWMKMAKIGLPKGSGKWLKVREKSVKSQGILKWILSGNPVTRKHIFRGQGHTKSCPVPSTSCDLSRYKV